MYDPVIKMRFNELLQSGLRYGSIRQIFKKEFPGQNPSNPTFRYWEGKLKAETGYDQDEAFTEAAVARHDQMIEDDKRQLDRMNTEEAIIRRDEAYEKLEGRDLLEYDLRNTREINSRSVWQIEAADRQERASTQNPFMQQVITNSQIHIENVNIGGTDGSSDGGDPGVGLDGSNPINADFQQVGPVQDPGLPAPPRKAD